MDPKHRDLTGVARARMEAAGRLTFCFLAASDLFVAVRTSPKSIAQQGIALVTCSRVFAEVRAGCHHLPQPMQGEGPPLGRPAPSTTLGIKGALGIQDLTPDLSLAWASHDAYREPRRRRQANFDAAMDNQHGEVTVMIAFQFQCITVGGALVLKGLVRVRPIPATAADLPGCGESKPCWCRDSGVGPAYDAV